ncbi:AMP-binding protein [Streptomyces sp. NPDC020330]|uniref:AMP-binding protein n=1 Tax=unclassified Streptomyces TaxID=2593676 RepID=UPI0037B360D5
MHPSCPQSIAHLLLRAVDEHSGAGIRYCLGGARAPCHDQSPAELLADAQRVRAGLAARGLRPKDKVVLLLERPRDFITAFWGAVLGGYVPCPMAPLRSDAEQWSTRLSHVNALLEGPLVVTTESLAAELPPVAGLAVTGYERLAATHTDLGPDADPAWSAHADDPAVLVMTSGSTGAGKAVVLTHANLLASMAAKNGHHRLTTDDTTLNWVSFDHVAALLECHLLPLTHGARQVHVEASVVLSDPLESLRLVSRHGVTVTFMPNFLLGLLNSAAEDLDRAPAVAAGPPPAGSAGHAFDLGRLRHVVSGGEAVVTATGEEFLRRFAPYGLRPGSLWPAFGMTETCAGSVYSQDFPEADRGREFATLGTPVPGLRIRIADAEDVRGDRELPVGEVGELQLKGPVITPGYYRDETATRDAFTTDGWFRSGDLGRVDQEGRLSLVGRSKDSIIVNGVNYYSQEIETALEQVDGVGASYVAAFPTRRKGSDTEQLVIAFHPDVPADDEVALHRVTAAVRSRVILHCGFRPGLLLPLPKEAFPKTSLGKIQRGLMRGRLEAGAYRDVVRTCDELSVRMLGGHAAPEGETERVLAEIFADVFAAPVGSISATASFFDLGGTSLDVLQLRSRVTRRLGVADLPITAVLKAPTVRSLAARLTAPARRPSLRETEYDPVVPLQTTGAGTPLFCVHPGVGEVLVFVNLARYFVGERPFYALRARGFDEGQKAFTTFEEMVRGYVDAVRARQPHGPYALAGYSFGAAVAFEMAKILEGDGERVDFLGSFNLPPHIKYRMEELDFAETATNLAFFLGLIDKRRSLELPKALRGLPREKQLTRLMEIAPAQRMAELDLDLPRFSAWAELADRLTDLGRGYEPGGTVRTMTVFHAHPLRGTRQKWLDDELRRWDAYTREPSRYVEVPGEHYTLMGPRHVDAFQAVLRRELARSLAEADGPAPRGTAVTDDDK